MKKTLNSFLTEVNERTTENNQYPTLTSSKNGIYLQNDYFNKQVASKDNTGYKIIKKGQFTYRAMSDTGEFFPNMLECADIGIVSPAYPVFKVTDPNIIEPKFLKYFFKSKFFQHSIASFAQGSTRTSIKFEKIKSLTIDLPDLDIQKQIVKLLDKVSCIVNTRKEELKKLDFLIKARFVEMFGNEKNSKNYPVIKVQDVADVNVGVVIKPSQYYTDSEHGVKAFRSLNIGEMYVKNEDWVYFSEEGQRKNTKSILRKDDLVIVRSGAPGTACVITEEYEGSNAVDVIIAHPDKDKVNPYYLCAFTNFPHGKSQIKKGTGGAAQQHFNVGKYKNMDLIYPPKKEQDLFVEFVKQIDKSKVAVQKALDEAQLLFDSLMQEYFG